MDIIADALNTIKTHKRAGKKECVVSPVSKLLINVLEIMKKEGYIGDYEVVHNGRGDEVCIKDLGPLNDCGVIKPRFPVKFREWYAWEQRYLPSKDFGTLIVTTPEGVMTNREAREKGIGGRLIAYVY